MVGGQVGVKVGVGFKGAANALNKGAKVLGRRSQHIGCFASAFEADDKSRVWDDQGGSKLGKKVEEPAA